MSNYIKTYKFGTPEHQRLSTAAAIMTMKSPRGYRYYVGETYFDFGQNWAWTTILTDGGDFGGYQALNPREHEQIVTAETAEEIIKIVDEVFADKHCPDRIKSERDERIDRANKSAVSGLVAMYDPR